jgi:hypothetical protein
VGRHILSAVLLAEACFSLPCAASIVWVGTWDAELLRIERLEGAAMREEAEEASRFLVYRVCAPNREAGRIPARDLRHQGEVVVSRAFCGAAA